MKTADLVWLGQRLADMGRLEMRASAPGVPTAEYIVMRELLGGPPSTITTLASRTGYAQSRVSTAVAGLVSRGWAQTRSDPADGRRTVVSVPDDIRRDAREFQARSEARALDLVLARRPPTQRKAIIAALEDLLEALWEQAAEEQSWTPAVTRGEPDTATSWPEAPAASVHKTG
jgi:MarR family 2-MHQ and catechol resistance regulon transcriptional repressor